MIHWKYGLEQIPSLIFSPMPLLRCISRQPQITQKYFKLKGDVLFHIQFSLIELEIVDQFFWHLWNPQHWPGVLMNRWRKGEYTILNVWSNLKMGSYSTQSLDKYKYKYKSKCSKSRPATASTLIEANSMDSWTKSE